MFPSLSLMRRWKRFRHLGSDSPVGRHKAAPPIAVQTEVSPELEAQLFEKTARTWEYLGATDPAYSVITSIGRGKHGPDLMDTSGKHDAAVIGHYFARAGKRADIVSSVLEFGCGVGRVTKHIATTYPRVFAVDISEPHLELARLAVASPNVDFIRLKSIEQLSELPSVDMLYSIIVLQHNSPPVQKAMLDRLLGRVKLGGFALFQVPTYIDNYSYPAERENLVPIGQMEMHPLPQPVVFNLLAKRGFRLIEVQEDDATGSSAMMSHTFFAERTAG